MGSCKKKNELIKIFIFNEIDNKSERFALISIAVKTRKKTKRRLPNLCAVLTVSKNNDKNNAMKIIIIEIVTNKLILSINNFIFLYC